MSATPPSAATIEAWMVGKLAGELGSDRSEIDPLDSFASHGLASRDLIGLTGELEEWLGTAISPVALYEYPTIRALARHLAAEVAPATLAAGAGGTPPPGSEPVAIIGMECRFPGAPDTATFWEALADGRDCISEVPAERWSQEGLERLLGDREDLRTRWGGFIEGIDRFDADFFGIAPREAVHVDPQQRLLLEVAWDALADAGLRAPDLAGAPVGVFVGISLSEYGNAQLVDLPRISSYTGTGGALSIAANRLSYFFDLRGPSVAVDTACSSSLVAVHLACQSLRSGEASVALAAGANLILTPAVTVNFSEAGVMAADGRCKVFDARADGYVRAEGVGVVVLKPLSRALADGDRIYALILGSAVNQDGRTNGLMAPNPQSQEALLRAACRAAGVSAADVSYVEAHGTGTFLGDPIEAKALGAVYGAGRTAGDRCRIGSVKSNMGHLEAAAGIAGLMKVALALRHGRIPPSLHFETPNPHIPFDELHLEVQRALEAWPGPPDRRAAGVSSFGFGGANAHAILAAAPAPAPAPEPQPAEPAGEPRSHHLLALTAASDAALRAVATRWAGWLRDGSGAGDFGRTCATAAARRTPLDHRLAVVAGDATHAAAGLEAFVAGDEDPAVTVGAVPGHGVGPRRVVFVCPGQGGQWAGMGRRLWREEPVFRDAIRATATACAPHIDWELEAALLGDELPTRIDVVQPLLFAVAVALAELWQSVGVVPDAVVGHSLGEVAAAHIAGALTLDDAARVICWRSRLLARISGLGAMATAQLSEPEAADALRGLEDRVCIAAVNGPSNILLAGEPDAVGQVVARLEAQDVFSRRVAVDVASHSPQVEPLAAELAGLLAEIRPGPVRLPMHSTVTGQALDGTELDAGYWAANLRQPVRFGAVIEALRDAGHQVFVELGPHPVLLHAVADHFRTHPAPPGLIASMRRDGDDRRDFLAALARLFVDGHDPDWSRVEPDPRPPVSLPSYPWQRQRYWFEPGAEPRSSELQGGAYHPLLGSPVPLAVDERTVVWQSTVAASRPGYLADHVVQGRVLFPAAGYVAAALAAATETFPDQAVVLSDLEFSETLELAEEGETRVQLVVVRELPGEATFRVASIDGPQPAVHARGTMKAGPAAAQDGRTLPAPLAQLRDRCADQLDGETFYGLLRRKQLAYGPAFRRVESVNRGDGEAVARIAAAPAGKGYTLHPTLLDATFQGLIATLAADQDGVEELLLPVGLAELALHRAPADGEKLWVYARRSREAGGAGRGLRGDAWLLDEGGAVLATVTGLRAQRLAARGGAGGDDPILGWFYEVDWLDRSLGDAALPATNGSLTTGDWIVLCHPATPLQGGLRDALTSAGNRAILVFPGDGFRRAGSDRYEVAPGDPAAFRELLASVGGGGGGGIRGVVHAWAVPARPGAALTQDTLEQGITLASDAALHLVQALAGAGPGPVPRLYLLTADGPAGDYTDEAALPSALLEGMARSIGHEHAGLRCTTIDVPARPDEDTIRSLARECLADDAETHVALRGGQRRVGRLRPAALAGAGLAPPPGDAASRPEPGRPYRARVGEPGLLDSFTLEPVTRRPPGPGEIEIAVAATGLNFLDVLTALGTRPDGSDDELIGAECAGRVLAVGEGVAGLAVGDEVVALATGAASAVVVTPAELAAPIPAGLDAESAATLPIAFVTAWYALREVGRLAAGERVLVHSAATGTGLAALHVARDAGAEVLATAGNETKRDYLRSLGITHVMDSRSLEFAARVRTATAGAGVDVVFNTLAGDAIPTGLSVLRSGGRFLELGKRDVYANRPVGMRALRRNVSITVIDLAALAVDDPVRVGSMLRSVLALFEAGRLAPLPQELFPVHEAPAAMRWMAQAGHTGKIVLTHPDGLAAPADRVTR